MTLTFGLRLDDNFLPYPAADAGGHYYVGSRGLIHTLEKFFGLPGGTENVEYLRIEQYRQACLRHLEKTQNSPFYQAAFEADAFAVAADLLSRRDELVLAAWDFELTENTPSRLRTLAEIEACCAEKTLAPGFADRFAQIEKALQSRQQPFTEIYLNEPKTILPKHFLRLFKQMVAVEHLHQLPETEIQGDSDLNRFQKSFQKNGKQELSADGSLLVVRAKRATEAAGFLAKLLRDNPDYQPALLVPERNRTLDTALVKEGLPSLGIPSASLARPSLQILKLVTAFLWEPIDPYKILEFVSLSVKPLDKRLSNVIARLMANQPGINGDDWFREISIFFNNLEEAAKKDKNINVKEVRGWYNFWFARTRYAADSTVPKGEVIEIFKRLKDWAYQAFDEGGSKNNSLLVLSDQSRRIAELLEELPELRLSNLELERIVRTIYEPSPIIFKETEVKHFAYTSYAGAVIGEVEDLIWWNFTQNEPVHFFSRWYLNERTFLQEKDIHLVTPKTENALLLWQRSRPVLRTASRLVLVIPEMIDGTAVQEHPLFDNFKATFENPEAVSFDVNTEEGREILEGFFTQIEEKEEIPARPLGRPAPFLHINNLERLQEIENYRDYETYSSLNALLYYPYRWIFRYKIQLQPSSILSVVKDKTLMGNLAHKTFELLLKEDFSAWEKPQVFAFTEKTINRLLQREGAIFLMYGRAPERLNFINKLREAAWSFIRHLQQNQWQVEATELSLEGKFAGTQVKGISDLVLKREGESALVDLKWSGAGYRENLIRSEEDLQLALYAALLKRGSVHTSYFIMSNAKILARNNEAFKEAEALLPDSDHAEIQEKMLAKMQATYVWRTRQIDNKQIEVRTAATAGELEDHYEETDGGEVLMTLLEMKDKDAPFDDYAVLVSVSE